MGGLRGPGGGAPPGGIQRSFSILGRIRPQDKAAAACLGSAGAVAVSCDEFSSEDQDAAAALAFLLSGCRGSGTAEDPEGSVCG